MTRSSRETWTRVVIAMPFVPAILAMLFVASPLWLVAFCAFGVAVCSVEGARLLVDGSRFAHAIAVTTALATYALTVAAPPWSLVALGLGAVVVLALLTFDPSVPGGSAASAPSVAFVALYVGMLLALVPRLHALPDGGDLVLLALTSAWFGDTGAYFAGRAFGRTPLAPRLSPKKTVEGSIAGLVASGLGGVLVHARLGARLALPTAVGVALVAGVAGQMGDLFESALKRARGVKDAGGLLPGHGGLLDRLDGVLFSTAVVYAFASVTR